MNVGILQTGQTPPQLRENHGDYDAMCKALLGYAPDEAGTFLVLEDEFPSTPTSHDVYVITGSPCGVYEDHAWIPPLEDFIRAAYDQGTKLIGICFGHQILAQALGGTVVKSEKGYGVGVMDYDLSWVSDTPSSISLCAWHQDQVVIPPTSARTFLSSEFCPHAGLGYDGRAISFQPHPEFSRPFVRDLIGVRTGDTISAEFAAASLATLSKPTDTFLIQSLLKDFLAAPISERAPESLAS